MTKVELPPLPESTEDMLGHHVRIGDRIAYSGVMSLLPLNWKADDEGFRYLLDGEMDRIVAAFEADGNPLDTEDIAALHEAAWAYRAKVLA